MRIVSLKGLKSATLLLLLPLLSQGCGYGFYSSRSPWLETEGIRTLYVRPLRNGTYKPGVENTVYNALLRVLQSNRKLRVVSREEEADAILSGSVDSASYGVSLTKGAKDLSPSGVNLHPNFQTVNVATVYNASLGCSFSLARRVTPPGKTSGLWSGGFSRSKPFPGSNQLDVAGTTSALINDTEFDRALGDLAKLILVDMHEDMLSQF